MTTTNIERRFETTIYDLADLVTPVDLAVIETHQDTPSANQIEAQREKRRLQEEERQRKLRLEVELVIAAKIPPVVDWNVNRVG
jgi:hypothetical protein